MSARWSIAAVAAAVFLTACGSEPSVATKSAEALREAQAKGIDPATDHHGSPSATTASGAASPHDQHAGMDHSTMHGAAAGAEHHAAMGHTGGSSAAHAGHGSRPAADHSAMGHGGGGDHAGMGHGTSAASGHAGHQSSPHAATGHRTPGHETPGSGGAHASHGAGAQTHQQHGAAHQSTARRASGAMDHTQHAGHTAHGADGQRRESMSHPPGHATAQPAHGAMPHATHAAPQPSAQHDHAPAAQMGSRTDPHAGHTSAAAVTSPLADAKPLAGLEPAGILTPDVFDAARAAPVAEAAKAREGGHHGADTRGIVAGEDEENPPTPMPATRDQEAFDESSIVTAVTHDAHASHAAASDPADAVMYVCPMHPEVTSATPANCPKCGMALVRKQK